MSETLAVVLPEPQTLALRRLPLNGMGAADVRVAVQHSGISTGTERLLWSGRMPAFPGMGYPLVPGYESVGVVIEAGPEAGHAVGETVFVPGANCFGDGVRGLFGGAASQLVVPGRRAVAVPARLGENAILLALAATAYHAVAGGGRRETIVPPDLIVGHGVLGRLLARLNVAAGFRDFVVWERDAVRSGGAIGYSVLHPDEDPRRDYRAIYDVSGDSDLLDALIGRLAPGGEVVLAGFYAQPLHFQFAPAFMREARLRAAAEWQRADLLAVEALVEEGLLDLDGLITHHERADDAAAAYRTAFSDASCLKMVLDWRHTA